MADTHFAPEPTFYNYLQFDLTAGEYIKPSHKEFIFDGGKDGFSALSHKSL